MNDLYDKQPTIHFIIPSHLSEKSIEECLKSIEGQNYPQELIKIDVIENGKKDKTESIVKKTNRAGYHYIKEASRSTARNFLIQSINSDFIAFIDSDVELEKNWIKDSLKSMDSFRVGVAQGSTIPKGKGVLASYRLESSKMRTLGTFNTLETDLSLPSMNTASILVRKTVFEQIGLFNEEYKRAEDTEFFYRLLLHGYIAKSSTAKAYVKWDLSFYYYFVIRSFEFGHCLKKLSSEYCFETPAFSFFLSAWRNTSILKKPVFALLTLFKTFFISLGYFSNFENYAKKMKFSLRPSKKRLLLVNIKDADGPFMINPSIGTVLGSNAIKFIDFKNQKIYQFKNEARESIECLLEGKAPTDFSIPDILLESKIFIKMKELIRA